MLHAFCLSLQSLTDLLVSIERTNFYAGDVGAGLGSLSSRVWSEYASPRQLWVGYDAVDGGGSYSRRNENHCGTGHAVQRNPEGPIGWGYDPFRSFVMELLGHE